jgi:nicotinamidase/pyrazinamidase
MSTNVVASIDVDPQKTFTPLCPAELPVPDGDKIVNALNKQAKYAKFRLGSKDAHNNQALWLTQDCGKNIDKIWPAHAIVGSDGFELLDGLPSPDEYDFFVWKGVELDMHPYGACYHDLQHKLSTGIIEFLNFNNVTHVIVGGLALEYCVKETIMQLLAAKFNVILNLEATKALDQAAAARAIEEIKNNNGIIIDNIEVLTL